MGWLHRQGLPFETQRHVEVFTSQEVAASVRISGYELAKVVVLKADGSFVLAVVPAALRVDLNAARRELGAKSVSLAHEEDFAGLFPGCDRGAMPPFGNLWGLETYIHEALAAQPHLVFNAGSHIETVKMATSDYERLVRPKRVRICEQPARQPSA